MHEVSLAARACTCLFSLASGNTRSPDPNEQGNVRRTRDTRALDLSQVKPRLAFERASSRADKVRDLAHAMTNVTRLQRTVYLNSARNALWQPAMPRRLRNSKVASRIITGIT